MLNESPASSILVVFATRRRRRCSSRSQRRKQVAGRQRVEVVGIIGDLGQRPIVDDRLDLAKDRMHYAFHNHLAHDCVRPS